MKYNATALVGLKGDLVDVTGQRETNNPAFVAYYINKNVQGMTVIDYDYGATFDGCAVVKVNISSTLKANDFDISTIQINSFDCDVYCNKHPDTAECSEHDASATMKTDTTPPQHDDL